MMDAMTDSLAVLVFGFVIPFLALVIRYEHRRRRWAKDRKRRELWDLRRMGH